VPHVLAKLWFDGQIIPFPNRYASQIRKAVYSCVWGGDIFKKTHETCCRPMGAGGLGLIELRTKCEALFCGRWLTTAFNVKESISANWLCILSELYQIDAEGSEKKKIPQELEFLKVYCDTRKKGAEVIKDTVTLNELYKFLRGIDAEKCRVETKHPTVKWEEVWKSVSCNLLTTEKKSLWYTVVHDIFPTNSRLKDIGKSQTGQCEACGVPDTTVHRLNRMRWVGVVAICARIVGRYNGSARGEGTKGSVC